MTVAFVCITAVISLAWSHTKLISQDEMYSFQTDCVPTVVQLVHVQRTWPISLDPLLYHLLSHLGMQVFGAGPFALRFPALLGFLLMQVCLYFFVRNLAGERAGAVAAAFPALTATLYYSAEGRPYGLMLGLYALTMWCWQIAARQSPNRARLSLQEPDSPRGWALTGLAAALALTINAHYFGVLLLVPICAAEGFRTLANRKIDWPIVGAICLGTAGFIGTVPFLKAAGEFKKNYYNGGAITLRDITRAYRSIFIDYTHMRMNVQHVVVVLLMVFTVVLLWGCGRQAFRNRSRQQMQILPAEWVLILTLAALPFCGYLLARFVTHSIEVRYVLGALVGISAMVAISLAPWLSATAGLRQCLLCWGWGLWPPVQCAFKPSGRLRKRSWRRWYCLKMFRTRSMQPPITLSTSSTWAIFESASYYEPDPDLRARIALVYSTAEELRWNRHDTMALTAEHMQHFTSLPIVSYEELKSMPGEHIFILVHSGWDWTDQAFAQDGAQVRLIGHAMGWDVAAVRFK